MDSWLLIFITSAAYAGGFGGLDGADRACNAEAQAAGLAGQYAAWLSTETVDARDRIPPTLELRRVDGTVVANDLADLTDGRLASLISLDAYGATANRSARAWTGTLPDGTFPRGCRDRGCRSHTTCNDWTTSDPAFSGFIGHPHDAGPGWTDFEGTSCSTRRRLYCISQGTVGVPAMPGAWPYVAVCLLIAMGTAMLLTRRRTLG